MDIVAVIEAELLNGVMSVDSGQKRSDALTRRTCREVDFSGQLRCFPKGQTFEESVGETQTKGVPL